MEKDIIAGNKLIAEFMADKIEPPHFLFTWLKNPYRTGWIHEESDLSFHKSWDWLMPVIEKIGDIPYEEKDGWTKEDYVTRNAFSYPRTFGMKDEDDLYMFRFNAQQLFQARTLIESAWLAVVDFIKWKKEKQ